jgi:hypothetical protein
MNRSLVKIAVLVLPLAGLAGLWAQSDYLSRQGTDWEVEIQGYDPRDLLRGHYVEFTYDWPLAGEDDASGDAAAEEVEVVPTRLCLYGDAPVIERAEVVTNDADLEACANPLKVSPGDVYGYQGLERGRLYVGQDRATELERQLAEPDQRGIVTFRQRADGVLTPLDIRFRPLTPEEIAERDGPDEE